MGKATDFDSATDAEREAAFANAEDMRREDEPTDIPEAVDITDALAELRKSWEETDIYLPTGLPGLDDTLRGGIRAGDLIAIGGPAGSNKTSFVLNIGRSAAKAGARVLYATGEIGTKEVAARLVATEAFELELRDDIGHPLGFRDIETGRLRLGEGIEDARMRAAAVCERLEEAFRRVEELRGRFHILDLPIGATTKAIEDRAIELRAELDVEHQDDLLVVIVDPAQTLYLPDRGVRVGRVAQSENSDETSRTTGVARELRKLSRLPKIAVVFTSDTTKAAIYNSNAKSGSGFKGSYEWMQRATVTLWLHTADDKSTLEKNEELSKLKWRTSGGGKNFGEAIPHDFERPFNQRLGTKYVAIQVEKNRHGITWVLPMGVVAGACVFVDASPRDLGR